MNLTKEEKQALCDILALHLKNIEEDEKLPNKDLLELAAEVKYEEFISGIIKKLN